MYHQPDAAWFGWGRGIGHQPTGPLVRTVPAALLTATVYGRAQQIGDLSGQAGMATPAGMGHVIEIEPEIVTGFDLIPGGPTTA